MNDGTNDKAVPLAAPAYGPSPNGEPEDSGYRDVLLLDVGAGTHASLSEVLPCSDSTCVF